MSAAGMSCRSATPPEMAAMPQNKPCIPAPERINACRFWARHYVEPPLPVSLTLRCYAGVTEDGRTSRPIGRTASALPYSFMQRPADGWRESLTLRLSDKTSPDGGPGFSLRTIASRVPSHELLGRVRRSFQYLGECHRPHPRLSARFYEPWLQRVLHRSRGR
jgi:hypothetical protein